MIDVVRVREYESVEVSLTDAQLRELIAANSTGALSIGALGTSKYRLTAESMIGTVVSSSLSVLIQPKIELENVFLMLGVTEPKFSTPTFNFDTADELLPAMVSVFAHAVDKATVRGVLRGYQAIDERLVAPRGRIDITQQLKLPATPIPIACRFDEHTADEAP